METKDCIEIKNYDFGKIYYYSTYVIGEIVADYSVDTAIARTILEDINDFYGNTKMVYISNREFGHDVDHSVYKLVNHKKMIGIAIVSPHQEEMVRAAEEQALYSGSFGFFKTIDSAVSWAQSFVPIEE